ncbi:hypothetical protein DSM100688_0375 [Bifidobacterium ramosum]|uniref:Uncharacterized protein n=1 Tax=Bifidobacterium ramosum TaxID=1798158 RepID=A0A6L4X2U3_9BIFI|nr:hypothetical protein [Bifidobacterium ramosum]KAB8289295.1 hypothetical protein DSM100688_0375 [Bifidobacterium ramosum]NEG71000.1 hypothetical protein [Bifidobacterium ramosum]
MNLWPALGETTRSGVTCTPVGNGSYTVKSNATASGWFEFAKQVELDPGTYYLGGEIDGTGPLKIQAKFMKPDSTVEYTGAGKGFTIPPDDTRSVYPRIANTSRDPADYDAVVTPRLYRIS